MTEHPASILAAVAMLVAALAGLVVAVTKLLRNGKENGSAQITRAVLQAELQALEDRLNIAADARTRKGVASVVSRVSDDFAEVVENRTPPR